MRFLLIEWHTDNVDAELARDCWVVLCVADDVVGPGDELRAALNATDVIQLTTAGTDKHRLRPRHVTRPP